MTGGWYTAGSTRERVGGCGGDDGSGVGGGSDGSGVGAAGASGAGGGAERCWYTVAGPGSQSWVFKISYGVKKFTA